MNKTGMVTFSLVFPGKRTVEFEVRTDDEKSRKALSRVYSRFIQIYEAAGFPPEKQYTAFKDNELRRILLRGELRGVYADFSAAYEKLSLPVAMQKNAFLNKSLRNRILGGEKLNILHLFRKLNPSFLKKFRDLDLCIIFLVDIYLKPKLKKAVSTGKFDGYKTTPELIYGALG